MYAVKCEVVNEGYLSGSQSCAQLRFSHLGGFLMGGRRLSTRSVSGRVHGSACKANVLVDG